MKPKNHPGKKQLRKARVVARSHGEPVPMADPAVEDTMFRPGKKERDEARKLKCVICRKKCDGYAFIQDLQPRLVAGCSDCVLRLAADGIMIEAIGLSITGKRLVTRSAYDIVCALRRQQAEPPQLAVTLGDLVHMASMPCINPDCPVHVRKQQIDKEKLN